MACFIDRLVYLLLFLLLGFCFFCFFHNANKVYLILFSFRENMSDHLYYCFDYSDSSSNTSPSSTLLCVLGCGTFSGTSQSRILVCSLLYCCWSCSVFPVCLLQIKSTRNRYVQIVAFHYGVTF